jgi:hypothetical protein
MLVVAPDAEFCTLADILFLGPAHRRIVHPNIQHVHPTLILAVITAHIRQGAVRLDHDGNPVQFRMTRVKDVTRHCLDRSTEESVERGGEIGGDGLGRTSLDLMAVNKVDHLAIPQQRD